MTVRAPGTPEIPALEVAAGRPITPSAIAASFGVVVGGTPNGDVIVVSQRALAMIRAGLAVRALVIAGLETLRRTVALGANRTLRLESGIFQLV
ncbi:MAG: hypothetical protein M3Z41_06955 [Candidatus Eremiobacteraeota bacterium]|nr:hypothetical protein [Candidatus Eremiobacteraeota bacterium]